MNKFLVGLVLGIAIAGGVVIYLNNMPLQFTKNNINSKITSNDIGLKNATAPITLLPNTKIQEQASGIEPSNSSAPTPKYDFYDVLPGKESSKVESDTINSTKHETKIYVQAGAFYDPEAANDIKARVALLGFDAQIKTDHNGDKILNRVIMGPFPDINQAQQLIRNLSDEHIDSTIVQINN